MISNPHLVPQHGLTDMRARWGWFPRFLALLWEVGARDVVVIIGFSLVIGIAPLLVVLSLQRLVDAAAAVLQGQAPLDQALWWALVLFVANILQRLFEAASRWLGEVMQERVKLRVQERVLQKAGRLALAEFERAEIYDQLQRAQRGLDTRLFSTIQQLILTPASLITALVLLGYLGRGHPLLPIGLLLGVVPTALWSARYFARRYLLEWQHTHPERLLNYLTRVMTERPAAAEIRLFGLQQHLLDAWGRAYRALRTDRLRLQGAESGFLVLRTLIAGGVYAIAIAAVITLIAIGRISLGAFAGYLAAIDRFTDAIYGLLWNIAATDSDLRYIGDLLKYLDLPEAATSAQQPHPQPAASPVMHIGQRAPMIEFDSVSFRYPGAEHPVLDALSFSLRPGERIALVGENGAGKTTLAKLLLGLYQPTAGRILIDGVNLSDVDPQWWYSQAVAVFQDYARYAVTARENIGFGDLERMTDSTAIRQAAQRSGADPIIATLPYGYETILSKAFAETGSELSAGQWQAVAIARAYMRDAQVLVLDEPTATLDARAEVAVYHQFRDIVRGRSVLLISHRLGSARLADRILVLAGGKIIEAGSHSELMSREGHYATLYRIQAAWYQ